MFRFIRDAVASLLLAATMVLGGLALTGGTLATDQPQPTDQPQIVEAVGTMPTPTPEPIEAVVPNPPSVTAEPEPEPAEDVPAICEPGLLLTETGECVDPSFYADPTAPVMPEGPTYRLSPCLDEYGTGAYACYWDAQNRGNGLGRSFVLIGGTVYYAEP